jgi:hypothetical protein
MVFFDLSQEPMFTEGTTLKNKTARIKEQEKGCDRTLQKLLVRIGVFAISECCR